MKLKETVFYPISSFAIGAILTSLILSRNEPILIIVIHISLSIIVCTLLHIIFLSIFYLVSRYKWNNGICKKCDQPWTKFLPTSLSYTCCCRKLTNLFNWKIK